MRRKAKATDFAPTWSPLSGTSLVHPSEDGVRVPAVDVRGLLRFPQRLGNMWTPDDLDIRIMRALASPSSVQWDVRISLGTWPRDEGAELVVTAELPGVSKDDVQIEATPESLEIRAEACGEHEEKEEKYFFRERTHRSYRRTLPLPAEVLPEKAVADLKDGVLEVRLPKKEPTPAPKAVQVKVQ